MGRIVLDRFGAARRPSPRTRALVVLAALIFAALVGALLGGR